MNLLFFPSRDTSVASRPESVSIHPLVTSFSSIISPGRAQSGLNERDFSVSGTKLRPPLPGSLPRSRLHISAGTEEVSRAETL